MKFSFTERYHDNGEVSVSEIFKVDPNFKPLRFEEPNYDTYQDIYDTWEEANAAREKLMESV